MEPSVYGGRRISLSRISVPDGVTRVGVAYIALSVLPLPAHASLRAPLIRWVASLGRSDVGDSGSAYSERGIYSPATAAGARTHLVRRSSVA